MYWSKMRWLINWKTSQADFDVGLCNFVLFHDYRMLLTQKSNRNPQGFVHLCVSQMNITWGPEAFYFLLHKEADMRQIVTNVNHRNTSGGWIFERMAHRRRKKERFKQVVWGRRIPLGVFTWCMERLKRRQDKYIKLFHESFSSIRG